jgi:hypothetical protein
MIKCSIFGDFYPSRRVPKLRLRVAGKLNVRTQTLKTGLTGLSRDGRAATLLKAFS